MDRYDEDLHCNPFFIGFQKNHDLFDHVTSHRFMVTDLFNSMYVLY